MYEITNDGEGANGKLTDPELQGNASNERNVTCVKKEGGGEIMHNACQLTLRVMGKRGSDRNLNFRIYVCHKMSLFVF